MNYFIKAGEGLFDIASKGLLIKIRCVGRGRGAASGLLTGVLLLPNATLTVKPA